MISIQERLNRLSTARGLTPKSAMTLEQWQAWHKAEGEKHSAIAASLNRQNYLNRLMQDSDVVLDNKTFSTFNTAEKWQDKLVCECGHFASGVFAGGNKNLILCGEYGTGKTHLGAAIINHIVSENTGITFLAKQWTNIIRKVFAGSNYDFSVDAFISKLSKVDVLLIDELGANENKLTDGQLSTLGEIVRNRSNQGKTTIITTNYDMDEVQNKLGQFVINGLRDKGLKVLEIQKGKGRNTRQAAQVVRI